MGEGEREIEEEREGERDVFSHSPQESGWPVSR